MRQNVEHVCVRNYTSATVFLGDLLSITLLGIIVSYSVQKKFNHVILHGPAHSTDMGQIISIIIFGIWIIKRDVLNNLYLEATVAALDAMVGVAPAPHVAKSAKG